MILSAERAEDGSPQYISSLALATDRTGHYVLPAQR
ncbi:nucleobase permease NCS1 family protein [Clavibacter nebraskensis]